MADGSAFRVGASEALGVPAAVLGAGFIGYGSLAAESGYSAWLTVAATLTIWALPGQLILIEMRAMNASAAAVVIAVVFSAARFLPMTMSLMPVLRDPRHGRPALYAAAQLIAMTCWAAAMRRCPELPSAQRLPYFAGFAVACIGISAVSAVIGHYLAGAFPPLIRVGFAFLTPVYFFVILISDVRTRLAALALACGALAGPLFYLVNAQWSVLLAGIVGGSAAYLIHRWMRPRRA